MSKGIDRMGTGAQAGEEAGDLAEGGFRSAPLEEMDICDVLGLYRAGIQPLWDRYGRDYDFGRIEANIRDHIGQDEYWMTVVREKTEVKWTGQSGGHGEGRMIPGRLAGYLAWERHPDHTSAHTVAHLRMIIVRPDLKGSGLGGEMMERFEAEARERGCTKVLFDVIVGSPANGFYERLGYRHWSNYMEKRL